MTQKQVKAFDALVGKVGHYRYLVSEIENLGLVVEMDEETVGDAPVSYVRLPGAWFPDGSDITLGRIVGVADDAVIKAGEEDD